MKMAIPLLFPLTGKIKRHLKSDQLFTLCSHNRTLAKLASLDVLKNGRGWLTVERTNTSKRARGRLGEGCIRVKEWYGGIRYLSFVRDRKMAYFIQTVESGSSRSAEGGGRRSIKMTMGGDLKVSATLASHPNPNLPSSFHFPHPKVKFSGFSSGGAGGPDVKPRGPGIALDSSSVHGLSRRSSGLTTGDYQLSPNSIGQDMESFLRNSINMNFFERLNLAWRIIFPSQMTRKSSNARIAKQRLKMILFSDRCAVSDEAKQKIVTNIVHALSDFVEIAG